MNLDAESAAVDATSGHRYRSTMGGLIHAGELQPAGTAVNRHVSMIDSLRALSSERIDQGIFLELSALLVREREVVALGLLARAARARRLRGRVARSCALPRVVGLISEVRVLRARLAAREPARRKKFEEAKRGSLRLVPQDAVRVELRRDYEAMQGMIIGGCAGLRDNHRAVGGHRD
jgi:hypothetical protein